MNATKNPLAVMADAILLMQVRGYALSANDMREARAAVAELVEADREYDVARRDWDYAIVNPEAYSGEVMERVANRFESAIARRAAALAKFGGAA